MRREFTFTRLTMIKLPTGLLKIRGKCIKKQNVFKNCKDINFVLIRLGGPNPPPVWNPTRMTWIKPSFAWVLYRSGYGRKHNQTRVLKMKLSHDTVEGTLKIFKF